MPKRRRENSAGKDGFGESQNGSAGASHDRNTRNEVLACGRATSVYFVGDYNSSERRDSSAWREYMKKRIDNAPCAYYIYMMTNKPYGLTFLKYTSPFLSRVEFSQILSDAWARAENPNSDPNFTKRELIRRPYLSLRKKS